MAPSTLYFPPPDSDRWETVSPVDAGWDEAGIDAVFDWSGRHNSRQLVILDQGRIVAERYWQGTDASTRFDVASVQKCVVSFGVGVLLARKSLAIDAPMSSWLGDGWSRADRSDEREILLRHLLTMTSGLYDDFTREGEPGSTWYYNNNAYHQVRKAIETVTGVSCQDAFAEMVFDRIGMARSEWRERPKMLDPHGWSFSGLHSTARDMARFGLAVLAGGRWNGADLGCDASYLKSALTASQSLNPSYGWLWWVLGGERALVPGLRPGQARDERKSFGGIRVDRRLAPSAPRDTSAGMGAGDQRLYVVPSRGLVVVRHGAAAAEMAAAGGGFDEAFWSLLSAAAPASGSEA